MKKMSITEISHLYLKSIVNKNDIIIDATAGHGYDTLYLSSLCHLVYAFDIQQAAIDSTSRKLVNDSIKNVELIHDSHEHFDQYLSDFNGVIFNLGYLPKGNKEITTHYKTTLHTIEKMLTFTDHPIFIILVIYPGHETGMIESIEINKFLSSLDPKSHKILKTNLPYQNNKPPYIIWISK